MRAERQTNAQQERQEAARHSVVVAQRVNASVEPIRLYRESIEGRRYSEDSKGIGAGAGVTDGRGEVGAEYREDEARYRLPARSLGLGILGTLGLHRPALKGFVASKCPLQPSLARGHAAATLASFALLAWVVGGGFT